MSWKSLYSLWCSLSECRNMTFFFHFIIYKTLNAGAEIEAFFFLLLPSNLYCLHALKHWHMSIYKDAGSKEGRNWTDRTRQMLINCWNVNTHIYFWIAAVLLWWSESSSCHIYVEEHKEIPFAWIVHLLYLCTINDATLSETRRDTVIQCLCERWVILMPYSCQ